jgi:hypothetical protein
MDDLLFDNNCKWFCITKKIKMIVYGFGITSHFCAHVLGFPLIFIINDDKQSYFLFLCSQMVFNSSSSLLLLNKKKNSKWYKYRYYEHEKARVIIIFNIHVGE